MYGNCRVGEVGRVRNTELRRHTIHANPLSLGIESDGLRIGTVIFARVVYSGIVPLDPLLAPGFSCLFLSSS
ncbi:hypothetical protein K2173_018411 [Erythroxylum novogranatense]|uniref:Uncharacterized protein n=1 Tax=Erythroxylum novogranatense TaxID=1862640 RepID=A0AAV8UDX7_9ROSI|nr:hypothetical protein K2173_018411 [Erythroxylum novogranatense]